MAGAMSTAFAKRYVRRIAAFSLEPYRALTTAARQMPTFIIIGVQKGGTTSLYNYLIQHPNVNSACDKELHFFDKRFEKGLSWYRSRFPLEQADVITGEASPNYIFYPRVPEAILKVVPSVKLILLLRNPIDRAYSHYNHNLRANQNNLKKGKPPRELLSFEEAIAGEAERLEGEYEKLLQDSSYYSPSYSHYSYLSRGLYADQIQRWHRFFPKDQLLILQGETLYTEPASTFKQVLNFLNLPAWEPAAFKAYNALKYDDMAPATRQFLAEYFKPHNQRLYEYLGKTFDWQ